MIFRFNRGDYGYDDFLVISPSHEKGAAGGQQLAIPPVMEELRDGQTQLAAIPRVKGHQTLLVASPHGKEGRTLPANPPGTPEADGRQV